MLSIYHKFQVIHLTPGPSYLFACTSIIYCVKNQELPIYDIDYMVILAACLEGQYVVYVVRVTLVIIKSDLKQRETCLNLNVN